MRIRILFLSFSLLFSLASQAQTVIYSENWATGGAGWTQNVVTGAEGADPNFWVIADNEGGGITPDLGAPGSCGVANNANNTLHITSVFNPAGGAAYDAGGLCGILFCPQANRRTESPIINCTGQSTITLNFNYIEGGQTTLDDATIWYNDGTGFVLLDNPPKTLTGCGGQGLWTSRAIALPASADNNPNVQIAFHWINNDDGAGSDPSFAVDDITLTVPAAANPVVTITPAPNDSLCVNSTLTLNGSATNGPITAWAWTVSPSTGVVFNPDTAAQNPTVTFTTPGSYTFTLQATNGSGNGTGTQTITILPASTPAVVIAATPTNPVCVGTTINFTATPTNGGSSPSFQWQVNGVNAGTNSPNFSSATLNNNDVVTVTLTTSDTCVTAATAADSYTVLIVASVVPSVTITPASPSACQGSAINFTATPTNGGTTPAFQWQVNGVNAGTNSPNFSPSNLNNGDTVQVILTSNDACASPTTATDSVFVVITPTVVPSVSVAASATAVCQGAPMSFTASETNGGTTPAFQWQVNGVNAGTNSPNFSSSTLTNGDTVAVILTSNAACAVPTTASDTIFAVITPTVVPSVTVTATPINPICPGTTVNFTATPTNGGTTPAYQWQVNGVNAGTNSANFSSGTLSNNDVITVTLTSSDACPVPTTATASYTVQVATLTVSIAGSSTVCPGITDTLVATSVAGSTFSWSPATNLNNTTNDTVVATMATPGTYTYYVTASLNGCLATDSFQVTVPNFTVAAGPAQTICYGDSAQLAVLGGSSWNWIPTTGVGCTTCQNPMASPSTNPTSVTVTTYSAIVSNGVCTDTVTQMVTVIPYASASFNTTVLSQGIPQTIGFTNTSTNANTFFWTLGNGNTSVMQTPANQNYNMVGTYTVVLIAYGQNGCNDTNSTLIFVNDTVGITTPNIFTPNGDQINDVWQPSVHGAKTFECTIYNRWGILIYEFVSSQDKWDGFTTAGVSCNEGTYYYMLKATDSNNKSYNLKGFIQLIR